MRMKVISAGGPGPTHLSVNYILAGSHPQAMTMCGSRLKITRNTKVEQTGPVSCVACITAWRAAEIEAITTQ